MDKLGIPDLLIALALGLLAFGPSRIGGLAAGLRRAIRAARQDAGAHDPSGGGSGRDRARG